MKELPKVFANTIDKEINNTQDVFMSNDKAFNKKVDIDKKINDIFSSRNHIYKSKVKIIYDNREEIKEIVGIKNNYLLTLDNEMINITNIKDINKI